MNSWRQLLHRLLTIIIALHNGTRVMSSDIVDHIHWGYKLDTLNLGTLYDVTVRQCHQECYVRFLCTAYTYHRLHRTCLLGQADDSATETKSPGWIYSKKMDWTNKFPDEACSSCPGVCSVSEGSQVQCQLNDWCGTPSPLDPESYVAGNVYTRGSKVKHVCTNDSTIHVISTCLLNGIWSTGHLQCYTPAECTELPTVNGGTFLTPDGVTEGATGTAQCPSGSNLAESTATCLPTGVWTTTLFVCLSPVGHELDGMTRNIFNPFLDKTWHNNGYTDKQISVRWQPNDPFVDFDFTYNADDGSFKLFDYHEFVCDGFQTSHNTLHTRADCPDEDRKRFFLYYNSSTSLTMIKSKMYNRFVRIDEDNFVTTIRDLADDRAKFKIVE